jgi:hypothetical protein
MAGVKISCTQCSKPQTYDGSGLCSWRAFDPASCDGTQIMSVAGFYDAIEALVKLWKHTPKIDNGRCMVCGIGYVSWIPGDSGELKVGPCDRDDCLSHVVTKALAKAGAP